MATLPTGIVVTTTGNYSDNTEVIAGAAIGITDGSDVTTGFFRRAIPLKDAASDDIPVRRSVPQAVSGVAHAFSAQKAYTAGTFAREATSSEWLVRTLATTINGVSNTTIFFNGNEQHRARTLVSNKSKGAKTVTAHVAGYWNPVGITGQRTNWSTSPATNNVSYVLPTNNASDAVDQALFVTYKSVPGELTYHYGSGASPTTDEYKAKTL